MAGAVANVNTVGTNINNVNATGGSIANVNTVAGQISPTNNLGTVAGISTEIGNVSGISSAVSSVGGAITNVNAVAGQISPTNNISTVASNISDIQDVGGNIGAITTVNGISGNVSTVAGISSDVTTVAGNNNNITNVANNNTNITTVAGAATNINTVAANVSNVGTVASISSDVTTAAGISSNISAVANISSDVSTVASNVTGVNSFADRYRVGSSDPSSSNDAGDLFFNTSASALKFYNGTQWNQITTFSGNYNDLTNTPTIPAAPAIEDNSGTPALATGITAAEVRTAIGAGTSDLQLGTTATTALAGNTVIPTNTNQLTNGAGFITSADGGDATTLDGLDLHTGRNNEANKVVRSNSNGYVDFGWINTTSGATTNTIDKIYASNDDYIRYITPATFRSQVINGQTINEIYNNGWYRTYGQKGWYNQTYGGGIYMADSTYVRTYGSKQFYVDNHIKAASNVYAYWSDDRLKTKIGNIDNALDKVQSLSGFTYTRNDVAKSHGFDGDEVEVGVSAQQVKAVLPEAVHLAPFDEKIEDDGTIVSKSGEDYMTVDYPRLVPLLIEAIKELKAEVDELKAGCCHAASD